MPTPSPASPVADTGAGRLPARDRSVITLLLVSAFVVILNETILSVALAPIMEDLHLQPTTAQWLTTAFMLTMAVVIPATGFLISRFTTRTLFTTAMSLFLVGTVICALSFSFTPLLLGRVVQATGTAIMMPLLMTTVMNLVPSRQRGRVMGNISIVISVAPALGPTISGLVLSVLPWRFLFVVVLPIALAALVMVRRRIEDVGETRPGRIDLLSLVLSGIGFGSLVYGLTGLGGGHGGETGGGSDTAAAFIGAGVLVLCVFIARQLRLQRTDEALLDLRTFASRNFAISTGLMVLMMGSLFGMIVLLPIYLQQVLDLPTLQVGLMLLPGGLIMGLAAPMVGRLYDRVGPRPLLVPGLALVGLGLLGLSTVGTDTSPLIILGAHIVVSIGLAHVFTPLFSTALGALTRNLYSHGSAIIGTIQQVAGGAGTAIMVSIMAAGTAAVTARGGSQAEGVAAGT
ncbi:MAG: DHA2 family efflux MFS transporter permease subunit, partial [Brachybacterium sp.]|nr:DHA2 family efflux MFS transporter permease subunit [Brachybacterium sp.]